MMTLLLPRKIPFGTPGATVALALSLSLSAFVTPRDARADVPVVAAPPVDARPVVVIVRSDSADLVAERVRAAVEDELHVRALLPEDGAAAAARGTLTVTWRREARELAVTYNEPARGTVSRVVVSPEKPSEVPGVAALLAGNMVRHEADELLGAPQPAPPPVVVAPVAPAAPAAPPPYAPANAGVFYPLATNYGKPDLRTNFDINLIYGRIGALDGLQIGTINLVSEDVKGAQLSFGAGVARGGLEGMQVATAFNDVRKDASGGQVTIGVNRAGASFTGLQASGVGNVAGGNVGGGQGAMGFNYAGGTLDGLQVALGFNYAGQKVSGVQTALAVNVADHEVSGGQASLGVNVAGDVAGVQLGALNFARNVRGLQLGLVNVADDVDGVPIGLVSVTKTGGVHPTVWASNTAYANVGIKFATKYTYTMVSGSADSDGERDLFGAGFTVGAHVPIDPVYAEFDLGFTHLFGGKLCCVRGEIFPGDAISRSHDVSLAKLRAMLGYSFLKHLSVYAGAGVTLSVRYPVEGPSPTARLGPEYFAGIQF